MLLSQLVQLVLQQDVLRRLVAVDKQELHVHLRLARQRVLDDLVGRRDARAAAHETELLGGERLLVEDGVAAADVLEVPDGAAHLHLVADRHRVNVLQSRQSRVETSPTRREGRLIGARRT